jgi:predicted GNAT family acetyltransferase
MADDPEIEIVHEQGGRSGTYVLVVDGVESGELDYRTTDGTRAFTHTGVRAHLRGRGLAAALVRRGLDDARAEGLRVAPVCSYVARYLDEHPADADLLAAP